MEKIIGEFETFMCVATIDGGSTKITIPAKLVKFMGIEKGDDLKMNIKIAKKNK